MRHLSLAGLAILLLACSEAGPPANAPDLPPSPPAFTRCDMPALEMTLTSGGVAAGSVRSAIDVRNTSSRECGLYGYTGLELLDAAYRPLPSRIRWSTTSFFRPTPAVPEVVHLASGAHAYIPMGWTDMGDPCEEVVWLRVTPPGARTSTLVRAGGPTGAGYVSICMGGAVTVMPIQSAY